MQGINGPFFLNISGAIADSKEKEFEQTIRFVFNQLPATCIERKLAEDVNTRGYYLFFSVWQDERSMLKFIESEEFQLIRGAYNALGYLDKTIHGEITKN